MAAKSTKMKPEVLPPTKRATHFYSLRVYFQLHERNNLNSEALKPEHWGWKLENDRYVPIMKDDLPAPSGILNVIKCYLSHYSNFANQRTGVFLMTFKT